MKIYKLAVFILMKRINERLGNPAANGYININNDIHFLCNKGTEREYYNRCSRVDSKG
jgi:hypothetical protein